MNDLSITDKGNMRHWKEATTNAKVREKSGIRQSHVMNSSENNVKVYVSLAWIACHELTWLIPTERWRFYPHCPSKFVQASPSFTCDFPFSSRVD